jgi:hypothetical protein
MIRTLLCSLAGGGAGCFVGLALALVQVASRTPGPQPTNDPGLFVAFVVGVFLAGAGVIAGTVIGGVADLLAYFKRRDRVRKDMQNRNG